MYNLNSKFDIKRHKETFINYLEVVITPEGIVEYAVPSHTEKLIHALMKKWHQSRETINKRVPQSYWGDMYGWLTMKSGYIMVWDNYYAGIANPNQKRMLMLLKSNGLYKGQLTNRDEKKDFEYF